MVVLLRSAGIHARNVIGFLGGQWSQFGDYLAVTQTEALSWVGVWFQGFGWVVFDPSPAGSGSGNLATTWFWPGRIFFDGLQHRWGKWVLDYSLDEQVGIFAGLFGERTEEAAATTTSSSPGRSGWVLVLLGLLLAGGVAWARRGGGHGRGPSTAMYLQLRTSCARAGLAVTPGLTPLGLVERVRAERRPAARAAERLVDLYLRARYGRETLGTSELAEMRAALVAARKLLRGRA
jgi:hypothetical protein